MNKRKFKMVALKLFRCTILKCNTGNLYLQNRLFWC
uniref:Uncharacterized protein n=1 Tax=Anguilla anguilla TaxID=7936 RepID=A0A0E9XYU9_ANGAN